MKCQPTRKVIAIDARNHGESPHSPSHSYEDLAEDVAHFYRQNNIEKAVVIGHSMGGRAMMAFALKYVCFSIFLFEKLIRSKHFSACTS